MNLEQSIKSLLHDQSVYVAETLQTLWSGYGKILRVKSTNNVTSYIVKYIRFSSQANHPRGWNTQASHQRKLTSYQVETAFYQTYAGQTDKLCKVPKLIACESGADHTLLVLEDLDAQGFNLRKSEGNWQSLSIAIKWLAYFHAKFLHHNGTGLWQIGSYWHLATRQDEFSAMASSELKDSAHAIDFHLQSSQFKTLIHGDAKFDNLCFHHQSQQVAAVDFQYIGKGTGVIDLAYLAGSCLTDEQLYRYDARIVDEYLAQFKLALTHYQQSISFTEFEQEARFLYPLAWADFYRFILGWNPDSWKNGHFIKEKSALALKVLAERG